MGVLKQDTKLGVSHQHVGGLVRPTALQAGDAHDAELVPLDQTIDGPPEKRGVDRALNGQAIGTL
jgi:hypothetical protein